MFALLWCIRLPEFSVEERVFIVDSPTIATSTGEMRRKGAAAGEKGQPDQLAWVLLWKV